MPTWARDEVIALRRSLGDLSPPPRRFKARICEVCNSRMGRVFEDKVRSIAAPMIRGDDVDLTPRQQVLLSGWMLKTMLVRAVTRVERPKLHRTQTEAEAFMRELKRRELMNLIATAVPPAHSSVRISFYVPAGLVPPPQEPGRPPLYPPNWPRPEDTVHSSVTFYGFLLWETMLGSEIEDLLGYVASTPTNDLFVRIWPPQVTKQCWPGQFFLDRSDVLTMREALNHPPDLVWEPSGS